MLCTCVRLTNEKLVFHRHAVWREREAQVRAVRILHRDKVVCRLVFLVGFRRVQHCSLCLGSLFCNLITGLLGVEVCNSVIIPGTWETEVRTNSRVVGESKFISSSLRWESRTGNCYVCVDVNYLPMLCCMCYYFLDY